MWQWRRASDGTIRRRRHRPEGAPGAELRKDEDSIVVTGEPAEARAVQPQLQTLSGTARLRR